MQPNDPRGIPEVVSDTLDKATTLVSRELDVLKREMAAEVHKAARGAKLLGTAGLAGLVAAIFGSLTVYFILDLFTWQWVSALIVTVVWAIVAAVSASRGKEELERVDPVPRATLQTVRQDVRTVRSGVEQDMPVVRADAQRRANDLYDRTPDSIKDKVTELKDKAVDKMPADVAEKLPDKVTEKDPVLDAKKRREQARNSDEGDPVIHNSGSIGTYTYGAAAGGVLGIAAVDPTDPFYTEESQASETSPTVEPTPTPAYEAPSAPDPSPHNNFGSTSSSYDSGSSSSGGSSYDGGSSSSGGSDSGSSSSSDSSSW